MKKRDEELSTVKHALFPDIFFCHQTIIEIQADSFLRQTYLLSPKHIPNTFSEKTYFTGIKRENAINSKVTCPQYIYLINVSST